MTYPSDDQKPLNMLLKGHQALSDINHYVEFLNESSDIVTYYDERRYAPNKVFKDIVLSDGKIIQAPVYKKRAVYYIDLKYALPPTMKCDDKK